MKRTLGTKPYAVTTPPLCRHCCGSARRGTETLLARRARMRPIVEAYDEGSELKSSRACQSALQLQGSLYFGASFRGDRSGFTARSGTGWLTAPATARC